MHKLNGFLSIASYLFFVYFQVFKILCKHSMTPQEEESGAETDEDDEREWWVERTENYKNIPNALAICGIRAVCTSWKFAVDSYLQSQDGHYDIGFTPDDKAEEFTYPNGSRLAIPIHPYYFICAEKVVEFMAKGYSVDHNPFINRHVEYVEFRYRPIIRNREYDPEGLSTFRTAFSNLLQLYGSHIWHAKFEFYFHSDGNKKADKSSKRTMYNLVQRFLSFTPNLKTLRISCDNDCPSSRLRRTTPTLEGLLQSNPLPRFEDLKTLSTMFVPGPLEKGLLLSNNHVRSLDIGGNLYYATLPAFLPQMEMNNVQEFVTSLTDWSQIGNQKSLEIFKSLSWPAVEALQIKSKFLQLEALFSAISTTGFGNTLKHLILTPNCGEELTMGKLELPQLKKLEMYLPAAIKDVDFIFPGCPSLKHLEIEMKVAGVKPPPAPARSMTTRSMKTAVKVEVEKTEKEEMAEMETESTSVIQFQFVERNNTAVILKSNIWTLLHELQLVKIVWNVRLRDPESANVMLWSCP